MGLLRRREYRYSNCHCEAFRAHFETMRSTYVKQTNTQAHACTSARLIIIISVMEIIIIIVVISMAPYLTNKSERFTRSTDIYAMKPQIF